MKRRQIVFIHGWGMNSGVWEKLIQPLSLSTNDEIIALDLPGYAGTKQLLEENSVTSIAAYLIAQLEPQSDLEPKSDIILIGWSLGGLVATAMAKLLDNRLQSLILIASTPKFTQATDWPHAVEASVFENFYQQLQGNLKKIIQRFIAITVMGSPTARNDQKEIMTALSDAVQNVIQPTNNDYGVNLSTLKSGLDILLATDYRDLLINLEVPVYLLSGDRDTLVPIKAMEVIYQQRQNYNLTCELEVIHHAGHAPFISHPEICIKYLNKVLKQND